MSDRLAVLLDDAVAGTLERSADGRLVFTYHDAYVARTSPTPLSLSLPTEVDRHAGAVLEAWLWGLLPDNDVVLRRWSRAFHVSAASPFALLSTPIGEDCAGAVRFVAPDRAQELLTQRGTVTWLTEHEVGERLRELRADTSAWLGSDFAGQFSLAGAQAKTALLLRDGRWGVPAGALPTTHILKARRRRPRRPRPQRAPLPRRRAPRRTDRRAHADRAVRRRERRRRHPLRPHRARRDDTASPPGGPLPGARRPPVAEVPERGRAGPGRDRRAAASGDGAGCRRRGGRPLRRRARMELADRRHRRAREELLAAARGRAGASGSAL